MKVLQHTEEATSRLVGGRDTEVAGLTLEVAAENREGCLSCGGPPPARED